MKINPKLKNDLAIIALFALCLPPGAVAQDVPTVKASGVRVIREAPGEGFEALVPFNSQSKGSALALLVESGIPIIKLDTDASSLDVFADDKGTNLMTKGKGFNADGFGPFPRISEDGSAGLVEVYGGGLPAAGAGKLTAEGVLVVQTASKKKAVRSEPFELKKGAKLDVGGIALTVANAGKPSFGDDALEVEFETGNKAVELVAEVKFLDADGKELESQGAGSSRMGFGKKFTYGRSFNLKDAVQGKVVLQFEVWTDLAERKVPFSIAAGIGG